MLFQPSNITPDEINGSGCFDATQGMSVSWQVNGDSAMTAYQIALFSNDAASTQLFSTGRVALATPFWGVNYKGQTQFFTAQITAAQLSGAGITNGNEYKMLITQWWSANDSITQTTASLFLTRSTPSVSINAIPSPLAAREYSFTGLYTQAEGDALKWVRWQIAVSGNEENPFYDSGEIGGTGELQTDYDGFFTGTDYAVKLSVETENGIQADSGWVSFSVSYEVTEPQGSVTVCQLQDSTAVFVQWTQQEAAQGYDIYRQEAGQSVLVKLASVDETTGQLRDYGAQSGKSYVYYVYPTGVLAYLTEPMVSEEIAVSFWFWSLIEASENADGSFSIEQMHLFRYGSGGVQEGTFSNNNSPQIQKNFTQYPTRQGETANFLSGSVSGYIGTITNEGGRRYADSLEQAAAFRALSTTENALFLLDPKGHFLRIATSGEITMTINHRSPVRPATVTVPWIEIDSTEGIALTATPSGTFYPVDNIIFTSVYVDPVSGVLYWVHDEDYQNGSVLKLVTESSYIVKESATASGEIASFTTEVGDWPISALSVAINPVQAGSGDPSPDNVRPISGWTGCNIVVSPTQDAEDGTTYSVAWETEAGTVYGGTLDVTSGVLTVNTEMRSFKGSDVTAVSNANGYAMIRIGAEGYIKTSASCLSNRLVYSTKTAAQIPPGGFAVINSSAYNRSHINIKLDFTSATKAEQLAKYEEQLDEWSEAGTPLQVLYFLSAPRVYQLTQTQITTLLGENNVWADTGEIINLEYPVELELAEAEGLTQVVDGSFTPASMRIDGNELIASTGE